MLGAGVMIPAALFLSIYFIDPIFTYICEGKETVARLQLKNNRRVVVMAERCWEDNRAMYYEIREGEQLIVPSTYLHGFDGNDSHRFNLIYAEDEAVVGVLDAATTPHALVAMHDFRNGDTWPRGRDDETSSNESYMQRERGLFERLQ